MDYPKQENGDQRTISEESELWIMVHSLNALKRKNIPLMEGITKSLEYLEILYRATKDKRYIDVAVLEIKAYLILGGDYCKNKEQFRQILSIVELEETPLLIKYGAKKANLNKNEIKSLFRKWMPSKENPMKITEVAEDIIQKVTTRQLGRYVYSYKGNGKKQDATDIYELIVEEEESYFHDVNRMQYYFFDKR